MALKKFFAVFFVLLITVTAAMPAASVSAITDKSGRVEYSYSRQCFYSKPYIFEIGWNISDKTAKSLDSKKIALSDKASMTVWYEDGLAKDMSDKNATAALAEVLNRIKAEYPKLSKPVVEGLINTGDASPETLVKQYYKNGDIAYYAAVLPFADSKNQRAYLKKSYDDGDAAFFSVSLDALGNIGLAKRYLGKAYTDDDIALFAICFNSIKDSNASEARTLADTYAEKAYADDRIAFFAVLTDEMDDDAVKAWYDRASKDRKISFKAICDYDDDDDFDYWDFDDWDFWDDWDEKFTDSATVKEYAKYGVTYKDGHYYYNGEPVRYFLDVQRSSSSATIATVETNPKGKADIKIVRDKNGKVTGAEKLTAKEIKKYFGDTKD
ncbi:MAG: hypothetical protein K2J11_00205 [Oscillospiraceae bacterium]|nr:hypothetical protein [Oscillospiraceae bacterium]